MRFVLDEDVDARVVGVLVGKGHEAWTIPDATLSASDDETVAIYGHTKNAVVVTHDREFSRWRRSNCIGKHLFLRCDEPDARALLEREIDILVPILERYDDAFCELSKSGFEFQFTWA